MPAVPKTGIIRKKRRKPIQRRSKFHASLNPLKTYTSKRFIREVEAFALKCRSIRLANRTAAERAFEQHLHHAGIAFEPEKIFYYANNRRFIIVDFWLEKAKTVIEIDGSSHKTQKKYDAQRDKWLESQGFKVVRIKNEDVLKTQKIYLNNSLTSL